MNIQNAINTLFPGNQGITLNKEAGTDAGVDVSFPAGYSVPATAPGFFRKDLSTAYQQVFQIGNGLFESFSHINALPNGEPIFVQKGQPVGIVSSLVGNYSSDGVTYKSTGPHTEIGFSSNPKSSLDFFSPSTLDPYPILESQASGTFQSGPIFSPISVLPPPGGQQSKGVAPGKNSVTNPNDYFTIEAGGFGIDIPKAPIINASIIVGVFVFVLAIFIVLLVSLTHKTETTAKTESIR